MLNRHIQPLVEKSLADFPVVLITGARQVGKSTLAQALITPGGSGSPFDLFANGGFLHILNSHPNSLDLNQGIPPDDKTASEGPVAGPP